MCVLLFVMHVNVCVCVCVCVIIWDAPECVCVIIWDAPECVCVIIWDAPECVCVFYYLGCTHGIQMQAEALMLQPAYGYHTTPAKPQRNTNTHRTRAIRPLK